MNFSDCNPFVRQAVRARLTKNDRADVFNPIKSVDSRLFSIRAGGGHLRIDGVPYPLAPGTLVLFRAGTGYIWEVEDVSYCAVNFDFTRAHAHITRTFHPVPARLLDPSRILERPEFEDLPVLNAPIVVRDCPALAKDVEQLVTEYLMGDEGGAALTSGMLKALIVRLLRQARDAESAADSRNAATVRAVIGYISANYARDLSNEAIAAVFHFNASYLNRIFRAHTGSTLHAFVLNYRLGMAMELLRSQSIGVSEAGKLCGFSNPYHFSKAFRSFTGVSPTLYRQSAQPL